MGWDQLCSRAIERMITGEWERGKPVGDGMILHVMGTLLALRPTTSMIRRAEAAIGVLGNDGVLVISLPNADVTSSADWDFHERDFDAHEFEQLLREAGFSNLRLYGQSLNALGRLREQMRAEVHRIRFNPIMRLGTWIQTRIRQLPKVPPALPEQIEDFDISPSKADEIRAKGKDGPFVIVAVATKSGA